MVGTLKLDTDTQLTLPARVAIEPANQAFLSTEPGSRPQFPGGSATWLVQAQTPQSNGGLSYENNPDSFYNSPYARGRREFERKTGGDGTDFNPLSNLNGEPIVKMDPTMKAFMNETFGPGWYKRLDDNINKLNLLLLTAYNSPTTASSVLEQLLGAKLLLEQIVQLDLQYKSTGLARLNILYREGAIEPAKYAALALRYNNDIRDAQLRLSRLNINLGEAGNRLGNAELILDQKRLQVAQVALINRSNSAISVFEKNTDTFKINAQTNLTRIQTAQLTLGFDVVAMKNNAVATRTATNLNAAPSAGALGTNGGELPPALVKGIPLSLQQRQDLDRALNPVAYIDVPNVPTRINPNNSISARDADPTAQPRRQLQEARLGISRLTNEQSIAQYGLPVKALLEEIDVITRASNRPTVGDNAKYREAIANPPKDYTKYNLDIVSKAVNADHRISDSMKKFYNGLSDFQKLMLINAEIYIATVGQSGKYGAAIGAGIGLFGANPITVAGGAAIGYGLGKTFSGIVDSIVTESGGQVPTLGGLINGLGTDNRIGMNIVNNLRSSILREGNVIQQRGIDLQKTLNAIGVENSGQLSRQLQQNLDSYALATEQYNVNAEALGIRKTKFVTSSEMLALAEKSNRVDQNIQAGQEAIAEGGKLQAEYARRNALAEQEQVKYQRLLNNGVNAVVGWNAIQAKDFLKGDGEPILVKTSYGCIIPLPTLIKARNNVLEKEVRGRDLNEPSNTSEDLKLTDKAVLIEAERLVNIDFAKYNRLAYDTIMDNQGNSIVGNLIVAIANGDASGVIPGAPISENGRTNQPTPNRRRQEPYVAFRLSDQQNNSPIVPTPPARDFNQQGYGLPPEVTFTD